MFSSWLRLEEVPDDLALIACNEQCDWQTWRRRLVEEREALRALSGQRVGLPLTSRPAALTRLFALAAVGAHVYVVAGDSPRESLASWARDFAWRTVLGSDDAPIPAGFAAAAARSDSITILTSGTTGQPKAVEHTWESLCRPVRATPAGQRWMLTYRPHLYAGLQVILQCLLNHGALVLPAAEQSADDVATLARDHRVAFASATPSYWRWLLTSAQTSTLQAIPLQQVTLGGEAVDQSTLDALARVFPNTRIVHIYATTELGRCFSVADGRAGFPVSYLSGPSKDGVELRIDDGELVVRSANAMRRYDRQQAHATSDAWFHTGDLVHVEGDRVQFAGRRSDMINVGGNKVYPVEVERVIRRVPGVADVRVYGEDSSLVGQLVTCDLVVAQGFEAADIEQAVRQAVSSELNRFQRPRFIRIVDMIPRTAAGKTKRGC